MFEKDFNKQPYVPFESVMSWLKPSCLRLVSCRRRGPLLSKPQEWGMFGPSTATARGGGGAARLGSDWTAGPLSQPPPPPLTGQRMCGPLVPPASCRCVQVRRGKTGHDTGAHVRGQNTPIWSRRFDLIMTSVGVGRVCFKMQYIYWIIVIKFILN